MAQIFFVRKHILPGMSVLRLVIASGGMKSNKSPSRRVPLEKTASIEEVSAAEESLSREDIFRLEKFARWRIRGLGRAARDLDYEDLLL